MSRETNKPDDSDALQQGIKLPDSPERLVTACEADMFFRYPSGRALRLAKQGLIPYVILPDNEIRFKKSDLLKCLAPGKTEPEAKR